MVSPPPSNPEPSPESPELELSHDLGDLSELVDSADAAPVTPEPVVPEAATPAAVVDPESWQDIETVDVAAVPESVRPFVSKLQTLHRSTVATLTAKVAADTADARAGFEDGRQKFEALVAKFDDGTPEGTKALAASLRASAEEYQSHTNEAVTILWSAFEARNPEYKAAPAAVKDAYADLLRTGQFQTMKGATRLDKMEAAYQFAKFQGKWSGPVAPVAPSPDAKKQGLVSVAGRGGTPVNPAQDKSIEEVEAESLHLLS